MVVYEGPSMFDGDPIVGVITGLKSPSKNRKTGAMLQLWIIPQQEKPTSAIKSGTDAAVCGDCPARGTWCYVNTGQAPNAIHKAWQLGAYDPLDTRQLSNKALRLGAWGDPAALPYDLVAELVENASMHTGYTHAWRYCDQRFRELTMASCDTVDDWYQATAMGWRTFRVRSPGDPKLSNEAICPASNENNKLQCIDCGYCNGQYNRVSREDHIWPRARKFTGGVVINAHGSSSKRYAEFIGETAASVAA